MLNYYKVKWTGPNGRCGEYGIWAADSTRAMWECIMKARAKTGKPDEPIIVYQVRCVLNKNR